MPTWVEVLLGLAAYLGVARLVFLWSQHNWVLAVSWPFGLAVAICIWISGGS